MKRHGTRKFSPWLLIAGLLFDPGLQAILCYRIGRTFTLWKLEILGRCMMILSRLLTGAQISIHADIGAGLEIFHASGLVIGKNVKIGENVWLFHNVTIGSSGTGQPLVGSGVKIFTGAVVAGDINIGDRAVIGANAVVLSDVQEDMLVESPKSSFRSNAIS